MFRKSSLVSYRALSYNEDMDGRKEDFYVRDKKLEDTELEKKETEEKDQYEKICFLCRRPESKCGPMINLPNQISICADCMQKSFDAMNNSNLNYSELLQNMPRTSA